jgi:antitoxin YefM
MTSTFELNANELNADFLKAIKQLFKNRTIRLTIDVDMDETEYLLQSEANKNHLMQALKNARSGKVIEIDIDQMMAKTEYQS